MYFRTRLSPWLFPPLSFISKNKKINKVGVCDAGFNSGLIGACRVRIGILPFCIYCSWVSRVENAYAAKLLP